MTQPRIQLPVHVEAVAEPQLAVRKALGSMEASLDRAGAALLSPSIEQLQACTLELESVVERLGELHDLAAQPWVSSSPEISVRLRRLQKRALIVQSMLRQGAAFCRGVEQNEAGSVLGYTPRGLEHAL